MAESRRIILSATPLGVALVVAAAVLVLREKSVPHPMNEQFIVAHYRGLGLGHSPTLLGRRWTAVTFQFPDNPGDWRVECAEPGYNEYRAYYPNGRLREAGECLVPKQA